SSNTRHCAPGALVMRVLGLACALLSAATLAADTETPARRTTAEIIAAAGPGGLRAPGPANTLYMQLASGRVVIELAPDFAPQHADNIRTLVREGYFDGLAII